MLEDLTPPVKVTNCKVRTVIDKLEPADQAILTNYLSNTKLWSSMALSRALLTKKIMLSDKVIARHRFGDCSCSKILK